MQNSFHNPKSNVDLPNHRLYLIKSFDNLVWLVHALRPSSYVPWGFALEFIARGMVNSYLRGDFFCIKFYRIYQFLTLKMKIAHKKNRRSITVDEFFDLVFNNKYLINDIFV
uniref:Uncharacterized protein n=1 Tax=Rhizophagus irregularis (strain DAOM 181602 / DAOM 197198 / MUCL 43194) TaxID=747089 RepID=U9UBA9_RHIID